MPTFYSTSIFNCLHIEQYSPLYFCVYSDDSGMEGTVDPKQSSREEPLSDDGEANGTKELLALKSEGKP